MSAVGIYPSTYQRGLFVLATGVSLMTLPFVDALTIKVGFPLKVYEVALLAALAIFPFVGRFTVPVAALPAIRVTILWMAIVSLLLIVKLVFPPSTMSDTGLISRFGPAGDGLTKLVYIWLNLFGMVLFANFAYRNEQLFIKLWCYGALFAAAYAFYLFLAGFVTYAPPLLPGGKAVPFALAGRLFMRNATFAEGNHAGLFFVLSAFIAFYGGRRLYGWILMAASVVTFSTVALLLLSMFVLMNLWQQYSKLRRSIRILIGPPVFALLAATAVLVVGTALYQEVIATKLTASDAGESAGLSKFERLAQAQAGWDMFLDNPLTGVGIAQYGYNVNAYTPVFNMNKAIPNLVYLEFLAEYGFIVLGIFLYFLYLAWRQVNRPEDFYLRLGLLTLLIGFFAYPAISVMFIWAFFGLVFGRQSAVPISNSESAGEPAAGAS